MKDRPYTYVFFGLAIGLFLYLGNIDKSNAGTTNPCEYMNVNADAANKLDVGDDPNWTRIVQQKNRDMIRACLDYETKQLEERTNDLNRDNY